MNAQNTYETAYEYYTLGRYKRARALANDLLKKHPSAPRIWHLIGLIDYQTGHFGDAATNVAFALKGKPDDPEFLNTLALIQIARGRFRRAINTLQDVLANLDLDEIQLLATVNTNLGNAFNMAGLYREAIDSFERALEFNIDDPHVHWNIAQLLLLTGDFENGWTGYENRFRILDAEALFYTKPGKIRWDGRPFPGKRLLVMDEQGAGDSIHFVRYLPSVKALGGQVIFQVRESLAGLMSDIDGQNELSVQPVGSDYKGEYDYYIPLASLPRLFTNSIETIPASLQYIYADDAGTKRWAKRIETETNKNKKKVGLFWAGNQDNVFLRYQSIVLKDILPYLKPEYDKGRVQYIGMQTGSAARQAAHLSQELGIVNFGHELHNFSETAALIDNLDLVICIDNAVAHLAGAMGKPVWLLLAQPPDWRWLLNRNDSPWYPSMRLFRREGKSWEPVFEAVQQALEEWLEE